MVTPKPQTKYHNHPSPITPKPNPPSPHRPYTPKPPAPTASKTYTLQPPNPAKPSSSSFSGFIPTPFLYHTTTPGVLYGGQWPVGGRCTIERYRLCKYNGKCVIHFKIFQSVLYNFLLFESVFVAGRIISRRPTASPPFPWVLGAGSGGVKPHITTVTTASVSVLAESDVFLPCKVTGNPEPNVAWTKVSTGKWETEKMDILLY